MKNAVFDTNDVKHCCESKLGIPFRDGKEYNGWVSINNKKFARITVSKGRKDIPPKTYKSIAKQLRLTTEQFDDLLECPLDWKDYEKIAMEMMESFKKQSTFS